MAQFRIFVFYYPHCIKPDTHVRDIIFAMSNPVAHAYCVSPPAYFVQKGIFHHGQPGRQREGRRTRGVSGMQIG